MTHVFVHIDRLVLTGFRAEDRQAVAQGLQEELGRMLGGDRQAVAHWARAADRAHLGAGRVSLDQGTTAQAIGAHVARRIHQRVQP